MTLPGGIWVDGQLARDFAFKPVTGLLELALSEQTRARGTTPAKVSQVLFHALAQLGGEDVTLERIRLLSVGDRQFLMRSLARHIDDSPTWMSARCGRCDEPFDISVNVADLPVKDAGEGFPSTTFSSSIGPLNLRVPNGEDQEQIARLGEAQAVQGLMARLIRGADGAEVALGDLAESELAEIESAIEAMAPEVALELLTHCPQCETENRVPLNPYHCTTHPVEALLGDIHVIASRYHWSEMDILALPRQRRQTYLGMIDRGRNMVSDLSGLERDG